MRRGPHGRGECAGGDRWAASWAKAGESRPKSSLSFSICFSDFCCFFFIFPNFKFQPKFNIEFPQTKEML
jgi:hypothetical protein